MTRKSPLTIEMMLACYTSEYPPSSVSFNWDSEPAKQALAWLVKEELIQGDNDDYYAPTKRGKAWIDAILSTPLPECCWIIPDRNSQ